MIAPLLAWYTARLDGEWEHHYGFTIETTDNPGLLITLRPGGNLGPDRVIEADQVEGDICVWGIMVRSQNLVGFCGPGREAQLIVRLLQLEQQLNGGDAGFL